VSETFTFIATKTTYATTIPLSIGSLGELVRRVRNAMLATAYPTTVGELREFPLSKPLANFLLCDGSEVERVSFPELFAYLGDTQGAATDPANFLLPDYRGAKVPAVVYPVQDVTGSDVGVGQETQEPVSSGQTGGTTGGNPVSGGRPRLNIP
jgi:hypothetical protein